MKTNHLPFKVGAVILALALGGCYVYDRAGGNLLPKLGLGATPDPKPPVAEKTAGERPAASALLPGSKSAGVVLYDGEESTPAVAQEAAPEPTTLLPGSKSLILTPHPANPPVNSPSQELPQAQAVEAPDNSSPPPQLLPGSKSRAVFEPTPQPVPPNAAQQQSVGKPSR